MPVTNLNLRYFYIVYGRICSRLIAQLHILYWKYPHNDERQLQILPDPNWCYDAYFSEHNHIGYQSWPDHYIYQPEMQPVAYDVFPTIVLV